MCRKCGKYHEYVRTIANYLDTPECCGQKTEKRIFTAPMGIVDIPAYQSPVTGRWINSRYERSEDLKRNGCRPWEGLEQEKKEADRQKAYQEQKEDAALTKSAEMAFAQLKPEQRRALETV
jgi:hypothetical protein